MTSTTGPRRFTRLEVQAILQEVGVSDYQTYMVLQRMGAHGHPNGTLGASVHRALGLLHAQNRPSFASPNTYGGMAWDKAYAETSAAMLGETDLAGIYRRVDEALVRADALVGNERLGYQHFAYLTAAIVEHEYGPRPQPPPPPLPAPPVDQGAILLAQTVAFEQVQEENFPQLFDETLKTLYRTWTMLPAAAKQFAAVQLAGMLRAIGVGNAAADQVETLSDD